MSRAFAIALLAAALAVAASGCNSPGAAPSTPLPLRVVAAENFWGSLASQLGGDKAQVTSIVARPNADPHDYEPTVADARKIASANMVIANGAGYDPWAAKLAAGNPDPGRVDIDAGAVARTPAGGNPHVWYSRDDVFAVVSAIAAGYKRLDPADAEYFDARRASLEATGFAAYDALSAQIASDYAGVPVGASESVFAPLAISLGLNLVTPPAFLSAISEGADPSAGDKATVDAQIRSKEIKVFVYNRQNATPDVMTLVAEAKAQSIPVVTITETLDPPADTFQQWQTGQLRALDAALRQSVGR
jgi:zinc/manganese transport system substrate-binding protein